MQTISRFPVTAYFLAKAIVLFALWVVTAVNGGIDLVSGKPATVDQDLLACSAFFCLFFAVPLFAGLESVKNSYR